MKKLLSIAVLFAVLAFAAPPAAQAQAAQAVTGQFYSSPARAALVATIPTIILDTATNTTAVSQFSTITGFQDYVGISVSVLKLTGTPGGKVVLYGKNKSTGFAPEPIDSVVYSGIPTAGVPKTFKLTGNQYTYYETRIVPTGTGTSTLQTYWITRKRPLK